MRWRNRASSDDPPTEQSTSSSDEDVDEQSDDAPDDSAAPLDSADEPGVMSAATELPSEAELSETGPPAPESSGDQPAEPAPLARAPIDLGEVDPVELSRAVRRAVARALAEDLGDRGDVTALATVPAGTRGRAEIVARAPGTVYGIAIARTVFEQVDPRLDVSFEIEDGEHVLDGQLLGTVTGPMRSILTAERTALNFLTHLSGIATATRQLVDAVGELPVAIRDTRKTTPGLRLLEKAAVKAGGGANHRVGLYDALLIKENHIAAAGSVTAALAAAFERAPDLHVQIEVTTIAELEEAIRAGATDVLLDNFGADEIRQAVQRARGKAWLEASGGITPETVRRYAETGVDRIAVGYVTHSSPALDIALDVVTQERPSVSAPPDTYAAVWGESASIGLSPDQDESDSAEVDEPPVPDDVPESSSAAAEVASLEPTVAPALEHDDAAPPTDLASELDEDLEDDLLFGEDADEPADADSVDGEVEEPDGAHDAGDSDADGEVEYLSEPGSPEDEPTSVVDTPSAVESTDEPVDPAAHTLASDDPDDLADLLDDAVDDAGSLTRAEDGHLGAREENGPAGHEGAPDATDDPEADTHHANGGLFAWRARQFRQTPADGER